MKASDRSTSKRLAWFSNVFWPVTGFLVASFWVVSLLLKLLVPGYDPLSMKFDRNPWTAGDCDITERRAAESPDGQWRAMTVDFYCPRAFALTTTRTVIVVVKPGQQPAESDIVLSADGILGEHKTSLDWLDTKSLHIRLAAEADVYHRKGVHFGIGIESIVRSATPPKPM